MGTLILYEDPYWADLLPLTYWHTAGELRCGRWSLMQRLIRDLKPKDIGMWVREKIAPVIQARYTLTVNQPAQYGTLIANARWLMEGTPEQSPIPSVGMLDEKIAYILCDEPLARTLNHRIMLDEPALLAALADVPRVHALGHWIRYPWELIHLQKSILIRDWQDHNSNVSAEAMSHVHWIGPEQVHLGTDAIIQPGAVIDATAGPVYIGTGTVVRHHAVIEGPVYIADQCVIHPGAWIRGGCNFGIGCKVGGEVSNSVFHARANKQHHGFVGDSYIGTWVNIGAGSTTSNLKNTYGEIRAPLRGIPTPTGQAFLGSIIGDFAKVGINQSLATGGVIGFGSSVALSQPFPQFVPSFRFIAGRKQEAYDPQRCLKVASASMARRQSALSPQEEAYFLALPNISAAMESS